MSVIKIYRNPPFKRCSGNAQILQPRQKKIIHHFILAGYRLYKLRMGINMFYEPIRIFTHLKEIGLFLGRFDLPPAIRAFPVHKLGFRPKRFTGRAVQPFICAFVNIPLLIKLLKNLLYLLFMGLIRSTYEVIIRGIHQIPQFPNHSSHIIHIFLRGNAGFLRLHFNFLPVFIGAGLEKNIISVFPFKPGNTIGQYNFITVANVRLSRCVGNRCSNIVFSFTHFVFSFHLGI